MKPFTFDAVRDTVYQGLREIFPDETILDMGDQERFRGEDFAYIELPAVTYSLRYELALSRVTDEIITKDLDKMKGTIEEMVPYDVVLVVACHSDSQEEAEEMALAVHRAWGRAPCIGGIGFYLDDSYYSSAFQTTGVYSYHFRWVGWIRIAGIISEAPLIQEVRFDTETTPDAPLSEPGTPPPSSGFPAPGIEYPQPEPERPIQPGTGEVESIVFKIDQEE